MPSLKKLIWTVGFIFSFFFFQPSTDRAQNGTSSQPAPSFFLSRLPLYFEPNEGQTDPQAKFISRGPGYTLFLTSQDALLVLQKFSTSPPAVKFSRKKTVSSPLTIQTAVLRMKLEGALSNLSPEGLEQLPGISNYFIGNQPAQWHTHIPQYARVGVQGVYPGINMEYYGNQGHLEYDFKAQPGANINAIRLSFEGMEALEINADGGLALKTSMGDIVFKAPILYQNEGLIHQPVQGRYKITGTKEVGFEVPSYDKTRPLVIDPVLDYATYLGGSSHDGAYGIAVDSAGEAFITGHTYSIDFPVTPGAAQTVNVGNPDAFVAKINSAGTALLYSTYLGGNGNQIYQEFNYGIAVDGSGNCYVDGPTQAPSTLVSNTFPTTPNAYQVTPNQGFDAYVTELDPTGSTLLYSTFLGGNGDDVAYGLALDPSDFVYVTGQTSSTNFPTTTGAFQTILGTTGATNAFISKLDVTKSGTSSLVYSTYLGGNGPDSGNSIVVDTNGNSYVTGQTASTNFPVTVAGGGTPFQANLITGASQNAFVAKLNATGTGLVYSTYLGGENYDQGNGIALDGGGNAYVTGFTFSSQFPYTTGAYQTSLSSGVLYDAFITKMNPTGTSLVYSTYLGGSIGPSAPPLFSTGRAIAVDVNNDAYVGGGTTCYDFPVTGTAVDFVEAHNSSSENNVEAFVTHLNSTGTDLVYSTCFGGSGGGGGGPTGYDPSAAIALDGNGGIYIAGESNSTDLLSANGVTTAIQLTIGGGTGLEPDTIIFKFGPSPTPTPSITNTPTITLTPTTTPTQTVTTTPTNTGTSNATATITSTPTITPTHTATVTPIATPVIITIGPSYPNPIGTGPLSFPIQAPIGSTVHWTIYTTAFRKVYDNTQPIPGNNGIFYWNLLDSWGNPVANGFYYVRVQVTGTITSTKILNVLVIR